MRIFIILLFSAVLWGQEKTPDLREGSVTFRSDSTNGNLDGSQTFDRRFLVTYDGSCSAVSSDSSNDGVSYLVFDISSTTTENLDAEVVLNSLTDSVLFLYCDTFDPANPDQNLVAWDDDGGVGFGSHIAPGDGVQITQGVTYQLVVSGFGPTDLGTFDLVLGGNATFGPAITIPTMGEWAMIFFTVLMIGTALVLGRRQRKA